MTDIRWLAGFFEAEGTISISGWGRIAGVLSVQVGNCDLSLAKEFFVNFGGGLRMAKPQKPKWRPLYKWEIAAKSAVNPLIRMEPHFISDRNKRRVKLALLIQEAKEKWNKSGRHTVEQGKAHRAKLLPLIYELKMLNRRGTITLPNPASRIGGFNGTYSG